MRRYKLFLLSIAMIVCAFQSCKEETRWLAPEISFVVINQKGDTLHLTDLGNSNYGFSTIQLDADGKVEVFGKFSRTGKNQYSGNILTWCCDLKCELDDANRISRYVAEGMVYSTGINRREECVFHYDDGRLASVNCFVYENGEKSSESETILKWSNGNLVEMIRDGNIYKYSYSKRENPLQTFYTLFGINIMDNFRVFGEFGYYGLGTKYLPIRERVYYEDCDDGELQLVSTKKIDVELDDAGVCQSLTFKVDDEKAEKILYKYD